MTAAEIESIVGGYHGDAFRILGPHSIRRKVGQARWEVRAFLPQAETAEVLSDGQVWPMEKRHADGFFCAQMAGDPKRYTLRAHLWDGRDIEIEDPYRFGQLISDTEIYLHGEGTLHEAYRTLGAHLAEADQVRGVRFAVWAPNAENVTVAGEFNDWDIRRHPMRRRNGGFWSCLFQAWARGPRTSTTCDRASPAISSSKLTLCIRVRNAA